MRFLFFALGLIILVSGCSSRQPGNVSQAELVELSREQHAVVLNSFGGVYKNKKLNDYVSSIVKKLQHHNDIPYAPVVILNTNDVNGFSLPTGHVYLTRGLIALANDEAELASVIAHEMAHVELNHAKQRVDMIDKAQASLKAIQTNESTKIALVQQNQALLARFSRHHEEEADSYGVRMSLKSGYDPDGALRILEQLNRHQALQNNWFGLPDNSDNNFLASHPSTPARKQKLSRLLAGAASASKRIINRERHLNSLSGMVYEESPSNGLIRGNAYFDLKRNISFSVPKGYRMANFNNNLQGLHQRGTAFRYDHFTARMFDNQEDLLLKDAGMDVEVSQTHKRKAGDLTYLTATAQTDEWLFALLLIIDGSQVHRFMVAGQTDKAKLIKEAEAFASSFHKLSKHERSQLRPRRIAIHKAKPGDTIKRLARRMKVNQNPEQVFRVLNGLDRQNSLVLGQSYKLVVE